MLKRVETEVERGVELPMWDPGRCERGASGCDWAGVGVVAAIAAYVGENGFVQRVGEGGSPSKSSALSVNSPRLKKALTSYLGYLPPPPSPRPVKEIAELLLVLPPSPTISTNPFSPTYAATAATAATPAQSRPLAPLPLRKPQRL